VAVTTASDRLHRERDRLVAELRTLGADARPGDPGRASVRDTTATRVDLRLRPRPDLGPEGFTLEVTPAGAVVEAATPAGVFRGTRQLVQNLRAQGAVPAASVVSRPAVGERGLHVDAARKFFPLSWWESVVREAAEIGVTTIQWHFSENEGFRLESRRHPEIVSAEHLSLADAARLIDLAADLHVEIVPSLDMPWHLRHALAAHPELRLPDPGNGLAHDHALDITNPRAIAFARELVDEYAEVFAASEHWNLGGDEFVDFDRIDDHPVLAAAARQAYGTGGTGFDLLTAFIDELAAHLVDLGFTPRVWNDGMLRSRNVPLDPRVELTWWTNWNAAMRPVREAFDQGRRLVNVNDAMFYYVLGENAGYRYPSVERLWRAGWHPGVFPQLHPSVPDRDQVVERPYPAELLGTSFAIWCDRPDAQTPDEVAVGIRSPLRGFAERSWNAGSELDLAAFTALDAALPPLGEETA